MAAVDFTLVTKNLALLTEVIDPTAQNALNDLTDAINIMVIQVTELADRVEVSNPTP